MNKFLFIAINVFLLVVAISYLIYYLLKTRYRSVLSKQKFMANPNRNYIEAVKLALIYGQVSSTFLQRRLKIDKESADTLLAHLYEKNIIVAPNEHGIAQVSD